MSSEDLTAGVRRKRFGRTETIIDETGTKRIWWVIREGPVEEFLESKRVAAFERHPDALLFMGWDDVLEDRLLCENELVRFINVLRKIQPVLKDLAGAVVTHDTVYQPLLSQVDAILSEVNASAE